MLKQAQFKLLSGDEAIAYSVKQCDVDLIAAYPITPQTIIVERLSEYVARKEMNAEYVAVESEHSALSACIGGSLAGARVFTSTSSQGLALMHEVMYIAAGLRCPIVMAVVNRALSAPLNIHGDHSDMMGSRDCGWVQIFCENAQEAYDRVIQAYRLAEDPRVLLPVAVNIDGFVVSHCYEPVATLEDSEVMAYLPRRDRPRIDYEKPATFGSYALPNAYFESKVEQAKALEKAGEVFEEVYENYPEERGRIGKMKIDWKGEKISVICMGSTAGTIRHTIRYRNIKGVSLISLRLFSPFPKKEIVDALSGSEAVVVMDRALSPGAASPPLASNVKAALYDAGLRIPVISVVYGLGGREATMSMITELLNEVKEDVNKGEARSRYTYLGLREDVL
ncbi:MAG: pyruvate ferredoxin oxidoreductase [Nitrososphaerota archaeon]